MVRQPPMSTRTDTLFPYTTLFRSYLDLCSGWFSDPVRDGNSILRLLHYPPVSPGASGIRAGAHEDINLITLLLGAEEAGLELLDRNGQWQIGRASCRERVCQYV